jgi:hypothetical protein
MRYWLWRAWKWAVLVVVGVSLAVVPSVAQGSATIIILPSSIVPYPTPVFIQISGTWRDSCKPKPPFSVSVNPISNTITISSSDISSICTGGDYVVGAVYVLRGGSASRDILGPSVPHGQ